MSKITDKDAIDHIHTSEIDYGQPKDMDHLEQGEWEDVIAKKAPDAWVVQMVRRLLLENNKMKEEQLTIPDVLSADEMNTINGFNQGAEAVIAIIQKFPEIKAALDLPFVMSEVERRAARLEKRLIRERD